MRDLLPFLSSWQASRNTSDAVTANRTAISDLKASRAAASVQLIRRSTPRLPFEDDQSARQTRRGRPASLLSSLSYLEVSFVGSEAGQAAQGRNDGHKSLSSAAAAAASSEAKRLPLAACPLSSRCYVRGDCQWPSREWPPERSGSSAAERRIAGPR